MHLLGDLLLRKAFNVASWPLFSMGNMILSCQQILTLQSIDDDFIDYSPRTIQRRPEQPDSTRTDPFICLCEYARICSMILKQLYSNIRSTVPRGDFESRLHGLDQLLQAWKSAAFGQVDSDSSKIVTSNLSSEQHSDVLLKYHELRVTIYHRYFHPPHMQSLRPRTSPN